MIRQPQCRNWLHFYRISYMQIVGKRCISVVGRRLRDEYSAIGCRTHLVQGRDELPAMGTAHLLDYTR